MLVRRQPPPQSLNPDTRTPNTNPEPHPTIPFFSGPPTPRSSLAHSLSPRSHVFLSLCPFPHILPPPPLSLSLARSLSLSRSLALSRPLPLSPPSLLSPARSPLSLAVSSLSRTLSSLSLSLTLALVDSPFRAEDPQVPKPSLAHSLLSLSHSLPSPALSPSSLSPSHSRGPNLHCRRPASARPRPPAPQDPPPP